MVISFLLPRAGVTADIVKANNTNSLALGTSWTGGLAPTAADVAVWDSTVTAANTAVLGGDLSWQGIRIANPTGAVTVSAGNTLTLGTAGIDMAAATQNLSIASGLTVGSTQAWDVLTGRTLTVSGAVGGTAALTKSGSGTLSLTNAGNTFSGGLSVNAGTLTVVGGGLGSGTVSVNAASTFNVSGAAATFANDFTLGSISGNWIFNTPNSSSTVLNGTISGGSANTVFFFQGGASGNTGALTLNGVNTFTGRIDVQRGPLILGNASAAGTATIRLNSNAPPAGALQLGNFAIANNLQLQAGASVGVAAGNSATISGVVSNIPSNTTPFIKLGAGVLTLAGTNTYVGTTQVNAGTLQIGSGGVAGMLPATAVTIASGATLAINRSDAVRFANTISGAGRVTVVGGGTVTLTGASSYTGGTTVTSGTLRVADSFTGTAGGVSLDGGRLSIVSSAIPVTLSLPTLALGSGGSTLSFELPGVPGVAPLAVTNSDGLTLAAATHNLAVASASQLAAGTFTLIDYDGAAISSGFTLASLPPRVAAGLIYNTANTSIDLSVTGIDSIRWKGNLSNVWNAGTAVDVGGTDNWLTQSSSTATNFVDGDVVTFNDTADSFAVDVAETVVAGVTVDNSANDYSFSGVGGISGGGGITKSGSGSLTVSTANAFDGVVAVNAGTLTLGNAAALGSTVGGTTVAAGATLNLSGQAVGGESLTLAGTLANSAGPVTLSGPVVINGDVTFAASGDLGLTGALSGSGSLTKTGAGRLALPATVSYAGAMTVSLGTLAGSTATLPPAVISNDGTVEFAQASAGTYSGSITGTGSLAKTGAGQLTLSAPGGFSGGATIAAGGLTMTNTTALGGGTVAVSSTANDSILFNFGSGTTETVANNFVLPVTSSRTRIFNIGGNPAAITTVRLTGQLTGGSPGSDFQMADTNVTSNHRGVLMLDNATNSFEGLITFWRGYIAITSDGALGNVENDLYINTGGYNGGLRFAADGITLPPTRAIRLAGSESIDTQAFNARIEGVISGGTSGVSGGSLGKRGSGTLTLAAANTYTLGSRIFSNGGTLRITDPSGAGTGAITIDKAGTAGGTFELVLTGTNTVTNTFGNFNSATSLSGGGSAHIRNASGDNTLPANLNLGATGGNGINIESVAGAGNLLTIAGNITSSVADSSRTHSFGGSGDGLVSGNILNNGSNAVAIAKTGAGIWTLSGSNTFSGGATVVGGTLVAGSVAGFGTGTVTVNGGSVDLGGLAVANALTIGASGGGIANAGSYAGTQTLGGAAVFAAGNAGGTVNVNAGGVLKGNGVTFTGPVSIAANGTHSPGLSPGGQTFTGGLTYSASSLLQWELSANTASAGDRGTLYDAIDVTAGSLDIAAGSVIDLVFDQPLADTTASTVNWGDSFWDSSRAWTVIDFSSTAPDTSTGLFTLGTIGADAFGQSLSSLRPQSTFSLARVGDDVVLTYAVVPEPGTLALAGLGAAVLWLAGIRRRRPTA